MSSVVKLTDFKVGKYKIPQNTNTVDTLQEVLDEWEVRNINYLLGCDLATLFFADLVDGIPQTQRFIDIFNSFCKDESNCIIESEGIKTMLKGMIWGRAAELTDSVLTTVGTKTNNNANSENTGLQNGMMYRLYNQGVDTSRAIQWFICDNSDIYPEYNGQFFDKKIWL